MGYTHYHRQQRNFGDQEWRELCREARKILKATDVPLTGDYDVDKVRPPIVSPKRISFNGRGKDSHETFEIFKVMGPDQWGFCKTARKPYDAPVVAILTAAATIAPGALALGSDGDEREPDPDNPGSYRDVVGGEAFPEPPAQDKFRVTVRRTVEVKYEVEAKDAAHAQDIAAARAVGMKETPQGAKVSVHSGLEDVEVWM